MKLYVTLTSPYARLARILVLEKALEDRVEIIVAKTRAADSPYYQINPSGRVPYLIDDSSVGMEDSQLICAYLDSLDGKPRFHDPRRQTDWAYQRLEFAARNMCEGICVWIREMARPAGERSLTALAHEVARAQRMADVFEGRIADPLMQGAPNMAQLILAVALDVARKRGFGDLTTGRPQLAAWMRSMSELRGRGRSARLGAGGAPEALSPGSPREATMARRAEAGTAVVAGADLRLAEAATPCRPRHADIARNDLSKSFYSDPRRAEERADGASADGTADASSQGRQHQERTGTDRRYCLDPRTASRG